MNSGGFSGPCGFGGPSVGFGGPSVDLVVPRWIWGSPSRFGGPGGFGGPPVNLIVPVYSVVIVQ